MTTTPDDQSPRLLPGDPGWVDDGRLWTAAAVEQLTPAGRAELSRQRHQRTLTLNDLRPDFAEKVQATTRRLAKVYRGKAPD
jgi:hypothetical protein